MTRTEEFESLFAVEFPAVTRTVFLICHDRQRAQDVTQDAFVELLRHWETVRDFDRPGAWVRKVAIRMVVRSLRRDARRRRAEHAFEPQPPLAPDDLDVLAAVRSLPVRQRTAVVLFYFERRPLAEIADLMGCAPSTAGVHLHRARATLGRVLEEVSSGGLRHADR
ncbi:RNA polymerase sigma factor [Nocardioides sp. MAHUQ-72]|uniref:RNA polymerase sigma factor n=1 Tax=unclassified Nocardioides TaxID=2615069 RepID=UPI0036128B8F